MSSLFSSLALSAAPAQPFHTLKEDFKGDVADSRDPDLRSQDYHKRLQVAKEAHLREPKSPKALLWLAETYSVMKPLDTRALDTCEDLLALGVRPLQVQRQGDFWNLYGRCLFLHDRPEESMLALQKAKACYAEQGSRELRRLNNVGLLRVYAALGKGRLAAERLEVALSQCEKQDEALLLYMHAKHALEHTGVARDVEVLDDIWYVHLDTNPDLRDKFEQYDSLAKNVLNGLARPTDGGSWAKAWKHLKAGCRRAAKDADGYNRILGMAAIVAALSLLAAVLLRS